VAARKVLAYLKQPSANAEAAKDFMDVARVVVFLKDSRFEPTPHCVGHGLGSVVATQEPGRAANKSCRIS
jgi:hypothetical protein